MKELSKRQEYILGLIVREYVKNPNPVGSKVLVDKYNLSVSPATVRNDMALLEELGFIYAPHTSAGRVPTEDGYRYFVQKLLGDTELSSADRRMISHQFHQASYDLEQWLRLAASVLANITRSASLVTSPRVLEPRFKHLELICTQGRMVLMIVILKGGTVRQQMLSLSEPIGQERLSQVAAHINTLCSGRDAGWIRTQATREATLEQEILELVADLLARTGLWHRAIYTDGLVNILDPHSTGVRLDVTPEKRDELANNADNLGAMQTLHLLEEQGLLEEIVVEALSSETQGVQVMIAGEGRWEELSHTSLVLSRYGYGQTTGALGILGPTRLHYGRAISTVRYVAGLVTDHLIEIYGENDYPDSTIT